MSGAGGGLDEALCTLRDGWRRHAAGGEVVIVEIDGRSIRAFRHWPWPRSIHAAALDRLREAGALAIAFDVDFSSPSLAQEDQAFAAALARAGGTVILPAFRQAAASDGAGEIDSVPIAPFADHAFLASANVVAETDGQLRTMPYGLEVADSPRPSLASLLAERPGESGIAFPLDRSIDPASIPRHSMVDLVAGRVPVEALRDKRVVIGATAVELGDRYVVPGHGFLPGVVVQALAAETLIEGIPARRGGGLPLLLVLAAGAAAWRARGRLRAAAAWAAPWVALPLLSQLAGFAIAPALAATALIQLAAASGFAWSRYAARASTDAATGLPNLAAFVRASADNPASLVALARIDDFEALASSLGNEGGARLVREVGARVALAAGVPVYRVDEASLAWLEPDASALDARFAAIDLVLRTGAAAGGSDMRLHFGAAPPPGDPRSLCANAALAAARAAELGQRWRMFTAEDGAEVALRVALLRDLEAALAAGEFWNAYQPKLDLASGRILSVEALVRWNHRQRGLLPPDLFIPLIEQQGRAGDLTFHVLETAIRDAAAWAAAGTPVTVAVNLSATLLDDGPFMLRLQERVRAGAVPAERIILEVTETAAMADPDAAVAALQGWRALGGGVSIDDYGTGQSSLAYLQKLPATELKIDRSLISAVSENERDAILVRSTTAMAHQLGLSVVAEGVEDEAAIALLAGMGVDQIQGYAVARPMQADALGALLLENRAADAPRAA